MEYINQECTLQSVGPANQLFGLLIQTLITNYCEISKPTFWPEDYGPKLINSDDLEYDFIVIGAGSAGSVVASRLSENPKWKVLLLEAGGNPPIESEIPGLFMAVQHTASDWQYYTEPNEKSCLGMKNGVCFWPRGKLLGGSSGINAMLYVRGTPADYDEWEKFGNPTWGWNDVKRYFKKSEDLRAKISKKLFQERDHSKGGLLAVSEFSKKNPIDDIILNAAAELDYKLINDYAEGSYVGYTNILGTIVNGRRNSAAKAFLVPAKDRKNLHIVKFALVNKINFNDNNKVSGVTFTINSTNEITVKAKKEVILSAGSIGSSQILMLSGIGPKKYLQNHGISVLKDLPVGRNLQDHPFVLVPFQINKSTSKPVTIEDIIDNMYNYLMGRPSALSHAEGVNICGFINTTDSKALYPDIEFHHIVIRRQAQDLLPYLSSISLSDSLIEKLLEANKEADLLMIYAVLLKPKSLGKIKLASKDINDKPIISTNYFKEKQDLETMVRALKYLTKLEQTSSFKSHEGSIINLNIAECNKYEFKSDKYWKCFVKYLSTTLYHPVGTAKMGPKSDKTSVVDYKLRVKELEGLRVADASIMPTIVAANTNAASIMIGEKAADFIKNDWGSNNVKKEL